MIVQSKVGVSRSSINGALVFKDECMFTGKRWMLSRTRRLCFGSVEVLEARLLSYGGIPNMLSISGLEGLCMMLTNSPSILLAPTGTGQSSSRPATVGCGQSRAFEKR